MRAFLTRNFEAYHVTYYSTKNNEDGIPVVTENEAYAPITNDKQLEDYLRDIAEDNHSKFVAITSKKAVKICSRMTFKKFINSADFTIVED